MANQPKQGTQIWSQKRWIGGIADYLKEDAIQNAFYFGKCIDYRTDPQSITLLPGSLKESGSVVVDLLKWGDLTPSLLTSYHYGNAGNFYSRTTSGTWTNLRTVASSHGNGLSYFAADDYVYYTGDSTFGRYGPIAGTPQFSDNFLAGQGVPLNTYSLSVASASSMYATAADSASLSVTGNLTLEAYFKATTLPSSGNSMTLIGKWDESGTLMSYKMDILGSSSFFGSGTDGALTISSNTTEAPIDSACTGTAGTTSLSATNASFAANQVILIHQTRGTNAGQWERNTISSYTAGTITTGTALLGTYTSGAQVRVVKQYTTVTINSSRTYTSKAWNGTVGGILTFLASTSLTVNSSGVITATGCGFRGASAVSSAVTSGTQGEGINGTGSISVSANGNGGGGGGGTNNEGGGAGGGNGAVGTDGGYSTVISKGGSVAGSTDLTTMVFGGGGGAGGNYDNRDTSGAGGNGGGILFLNAVAIINSGTISSNGNAGGNASATFSNNGAGGGGAGGSILLKAQTAVLGTGTVTATAGSGGTIAWSVGGAGAVGRININYYTSYTGTTTPTLNAIQDNNLAGSTTYQARLGISQNGSVAEYLTQNLPTITTGTWNRLSISWTAATSTAIFYLNAQAIGTSVGTKTAIHDNASLLYIGANKVSAVQNFFNGLIDDVRVWSTAQTAAQIFNNNQIQLNGTEGGLQGYWELNNSASDQTANANTLTLVNSPTYSTDVPFSYATTALNIDQSYTTTGSTYTIPTTISEAAADTLTFTPTKDPQQAIAFNVDTLGTGSWTVTIHDQQNNTIATQTIANANMASSGYQTFTFTTPWRIVIGKTYHAHLTVSTGTSKVVSSSLNNLAVGDFYTYYGFLVTDTAYHPIIPFLNMLVVGNERYLATWDGAFYDPNAIALPVGWRVRCFAFWREYLAIGVWRGSNITDYDNGRIYFWDGIAPTFNFFIDVPEGQINAMSGRDTDLYMIAGYRGNLMVFQGAYFQNNGGAKSNKIKRLPKLAREDTLEVLPGAMNFWRQLLHIGAGGSISSSTFEQGVYSWGSLNQKYPDTLSYDYIPSTGNTGSMVKIGMVFPAGLDLIVGWQDGIAYGADVINFDNNPAPAGSIEVLVEDNGFIWKDKQIMTVRGDHLPLVSGESVDIKYKVNRATNYTVSPVNSTADSDFEELIVQGGRGNEYQLAADLYATGSTSPTLTGLSVLGDDGSLENQF